jgi:regulator of RNase E activity RraB
MGFLDIFKSNSNGQFVSESKFKGNLNMQVELAPETLNQLKNYGVTDDSELKLEFFFYSKTLDNAEKLAEELKKLNYEVEFGKSAGDKKLFIITGWTTKMKMDDHTVQSWTKEMCEMGYKFDCEFDGWGTTPDQD